MPTAATKRILRLSREGLWIVLGQGLLVVGSLVGVRVLTGLLQPAAYGELALALTVATFAGQFVFGPLGQGAIRFYAPARERRRLEGYFAGLRSWTVAATAGLALVGVIAVVGLAAAGRVHLAVVAGTAFLFAIVAGCNSILNGVQNAARQRAVVAFHRGLEAWAKFLVAAGLILLVGATSPAALVGYSIAVVVVLGSQYLFLRRVAPAGEEDTSDGRAWRRQIWAYSWPFATWGIFTWAQLASDRWFLELFTSTRDVGLYAVLFRLGYYPVQVVSAMALQMVTPVFFQRAGDGRDLRRTARVRKSIWWLLGLVLCGTAAGALLADIFHAQIFSILAGSRYASVSGLLPWVFVASGLFAAGQVVAISRLTRLESRALMPVKVTTGVLGIGLNLVGAWLYGLEGIVVAGAAFGFVYLFLMVVDERRGNGRASQPEELRP